MGTIYFFTRFVVLTSCLFWASLSFSKSPGLGGPNADKFLCEAVKSGLDKDRFPKELAIALENRRDLWVTKCPICMPVSRAFSDYGRSEGAVKKTKVQQSILDDLQAEDLAKAKAALGTLVDEYVRQHFSRLKMAPEAVDEMKAALAEARKKGMNLAGDRGEGFFCPSCDGACGIPTRQ